MKKMPELIAGVRAFADLDPEHLELIAGCAQNKVFERGVELMREGDAADTFYVIRTGFVALQTFVPERGSITIETIESGDLVGWSWLMPPYRTHLDALALETTHTLAFDAACLRGKFDDDPALGYALMKRFVPVIVERLQATRLRLLDVYGNVPAG
jgi:CRP-like cAMP-binding protein